MRFLFGGHLLDVSRRELQRRGKQVALEPQVFDLLAYLVQNRERVVSKDDLTAHVWHGRIVSPSALMTRLHAARAAVGDDGAAQRVIRTVVRAGVRFVAEVTEEEEPGVSANDPTPALPDKPSIAVLPFQNMSGDPGQDYFADGVVEEITTALARIRWLFVIARNSSFTYKGRSVDVRRVGRELGVRYVLEGSIRKNGERVRITAQLIEAENGTHLWADRFDGLVMDVFDLQDQIAANVAGTIEPKLILAEIERTGRKPTESLNAYDLYLRAISRFHQYGERNLEDAASLAMKALAADPNFSRAAALVGFCRAAQAAETWGTLCSATIAEAIRLARLGIETGHDDPDALWMSACAMAAFAADHPSAKAAVERALLLNPNAAYAWWTRGWISIFTDQPEAAMDSFRHASRLSPLDPLGWIISGGITGALLVARRFAEVLDWADRTLRDKPRYSVMLRYKAIACAHLGRVEEARQHIFAMLVSQPEFTIHGWATTIGATAFSAPTTAMLVEGLRKAGAPE